MGRPRKIRPEETVTPSTNDVETADIAMGSSANELINSSDYASTKAEKAEKPEKVKKEKKSKASMDNYNEGKDALVGMLSESLNKKFKDQPQVAYILDDEENPSNITKWVSTGNDVLDLVISNRAHGGLPGGRIIELTGLEGCVTEDTLVDVIIE